MTKLGNIVVGLDVGTSSVCCLVGEVTETGCEVIGVGRVESQGIRKGVVMNIDATVQSIRRAVDDAQLMAGCEISQVYCSVTGGHLRSLNSEGMVAVKDKHVTDADVTRVLDTAQAVAIPMDREVIHVIPQEYIVDDQDSIAEPRGMSGVRLAAKVHIVTIAKAAGQNLVKCCNLAGLTVRGIVFGTLASAEAVLTTDERDLGVMLLDIGGGTMDTSIFNRGSVVHSSVLALGGDHISKDIAYGLRTPVAQAERIKRQWGAASTALLEEDTDFEVPSVGGHRTRTASRQTLAEIVEPRVEEMFGLVKAELDRTPYRDLLPAGVVLTGGTNLLNGMTEVAERVFGLPVRVGTPDNVSGLSEVVSSPVFATALGLLHFAAEAEKDVQPVEVEEEDFMGRFRSRMAHWFGSFF